ncbi:MAG: type IV pili methyl-accepting chemotaxis transducer N-terminal domain-containing protein [Aureispira sp.]
MKTGFLVLLFLVSTVVHAINFNEQLPLGQAIAQAGSQRMLSQRLAKSYLAILTRTNMHNHLNQMEEDIKSFEKNYTAIKNLPLITPRILQEIKNVEKEWAIYKQLLKKAPLVEEATAILAQNSILLDKCQIVVESLERKAQKIGLHFDAHNSYSSLAHLTNIAERQRMLSQRILTYYLADRLKIPDPTIAAKLQKATDLYSNTLHQLMGALENTPEIDFKLVCLLDSWKKVEAICRNLEAFSDQSMEDVMHMIDFMFSEMDAVTNMYESLIDADIAALMLSNALNKAGRQRMLCQKITKAYLAVTLDIDAPRHQVELEEAIALFSSSLEDLKTYAPISEIEEAVLHTESLWKEYQVLVTNQQQLKTNSKLLIEQNTTLLRSCHSLVLLLKVYSKTISRSNIRYTNNLVNLIDLAEQQHMLSQRMVLYCMAANWMPEKEVVELELHKTITQYSTNLEILRNSSNNTPEIRERLQSIMNNWTFIAKLCSEGGEENRNQLLQTSNQLLSDMSEVTTLYENIIGSLVDIEAVNKAGIQRMLSQRIALDALAITMNIDVNSRKEQLQKDIALFNRQLDELKFYTTNHNAQTALAKVITHWKLYKKHVSGDLTDWDIKYLIEHNTALLNACHEVALKIMDESVIECRFIPLLQLAGTQRMLSQRIALYALAYRKGGHQELCKGILDESIVQFKASLTKLERSSVNTPTIYALIDKQKNLIKRLEGYIATIDKVDLFQILMTNNILLADAEMLVKAYEQLNETL